MPAIQRQTTFTTLLLPRTAKPEGPSSFCQPALIEAQSDEIGEIGRGAHATESVTPINRSWMVGASGSNFVLYSPLMDWLTPEQRTRNMSAIRSRGNKSTEKAIRFRTSDRPSAKGEVQKAFAEGPSLEGSTLPFRRGRPLVPRFESRGVCAPVIRSSLSSMVRISFSAKDWQSE